MLSDWKRFEVWRASTLCAVRRRCVWHGELVIAVAHARESCRIVHGGEGEWEKQIVVEKAIGMIKHDVKSAFIGRGSASHAHAELTLPDVVSAVWAASYLGHSSPDRTFVR